VLDKADGFFAEWGSIVLGRPTTHEGSERDHKADKRFYYALMGGLALYELRVKNYATATFLVGNMAVVAWRDNEMKTEREIAHEQGFDTSAPRINKWKTTFQMTGIVAKSLPVENNAGPNALITGGTALAVKTYLMFKKHRQAGTLPQAK
jgi:hypothetical protein